MISMAVLQEQGWGVRAGWRHTLKPWSGAVYGNHKAKPGSFASITAPKGAFFVNPKNSCLDSIFHKLAC